MGRRQTTTGDGQVQSRVARTLGDNRLVGKRAGEADANDGLESGHGPGGVFSAFNDAFRGGRLSAPASCRCRRGLRSAAVRAVGMLDERALETDRRCPRRSPRGRSPRVWLGFVSDRAHMGTKLTKHGRTRGLILIPGVPLMVIWLRRSPGREPLYKESTQVPFLCAVF